MSKTMGHHHRGHARHAEISEEPAEQAALAGQKVSAEERIRLIQLRAYGLWEQAGQPVGDAAREQFWSEAEHEFTASHASDE